MKEVARALLDDEHFKGVCDAVARSARNRLMGQLRARVKLGEAVHAAGIEGMIQGFEKFYMALEQYANSKEEA